jgi:cation diffusion facilitator family transporter
MLILIAAGGIAWYALVRLYAPAELSSVDLGAVIALVSAGINLAVARILIRAGHRSESIVLEAEGHHLMSDLWASVGVVLGLEAAAHTGLHWLDPVVAIAVAIKITWTGLVLVRKSFNGLMDHALPEEEQAAVRQAIESQLEPGMAYHALRTRRAGTRRFADFHLLVPGNLSVRKAHDLSKRIEEAVRQAFPGIETTVHIEPIEDRASWEDSELLGVEQSGRREQN